MFTAAEPQPLMGRDFPPKCLPVHQPQPSSPPKVTSPMLPTTIHGNRTPSHAEPTFRSRSLGGPSQPPTSSVNTSNTPHISVMRPPCRSPAGQHRVTAHCTWTPQQLLPTHSPKGKASLPTVASRPSVTCRSQGSISTHTASTPLPPRTPALAAPSPLAPVTSTRPAPALMPNADPPLLTQLCFLAIQLTHCACSLSSAPGIT